MRVAWAVVTHMYPDDTGPYDRLWMHMMRIGLVLQECAGATVRLWDALRRAGEDVSLRRVGQGFIVHYNVFHRIEKILNNGTIDPLEHPKVAFCKKDYNVHVSDKYGKTCSKRDHTWFETFEMAIRSVSNAMREDLHIDQVVFSDENVVLRSGDRGDEWDRFLREQCAAEPMVVLCDDHRGHRDAPQAHEEPAWARTRAATRRVARPRFPMAFTMRRDVVHVARAIVDRVARDADCRAMAMDLIVAAVGVKESYPPMMWNMDEYIARIRVDTTYEHIEDALLHCAPSALGDREPEQVIHQIWIGKAMPPHLRTEHERIKQLHGADRVRLWGNEHVHTLPHTMDNLNQVTSYAMLCDLARLEILYAHGGVYIDMDFAIIKNVFPLFTTDISLCENLTMQGALSITNSIMGAKKGNLSICKFLSYWRRSMCADGAYRFTLSTGPIHTQKLYRSVVDRVRLPAGKPCVQLLPPTFFFGKHWKDHATHPDACYGRHLFASTYWHAETI